VVQLYRIVVSCYNYIFVNTNINKYKTEIMGKSVGRGTA
jgi:hypothetical protein